MGRILRLILIGCAAVVAFAVLYGCGQASSPIEKQEKEEGIEGAAKDQQPVKTVEVPTTPEATPQAPEEPPEYSIEGVYIDKGGGPGSAAVFKLIAPDVERGEEAARLAAAKYAEHDYVMMDLYASEEAVDSYAFATKAFTERGAGWTGLSVGEMRYEPK